MKLLHKLLAKLLRRNLKFTPANVIIAQMTEPRSLPMGIKEFHEWSDRIISGALIPGGEDDPESFIESQKFTLADMLLHLGPTESHKPDAHFIHCLRKYAINQIAFACKTELSTKVKAKLKAKEEAEASLKAGLANLKAAENTVTIKSSDSSPEVH